VWRERALMRFLAMHALSAVAVVALSTANHVATCEALARLSLPNTRITQSQIVPAGDFKIPGVPPTVPPLRQLPAFCRVTAHAVGNGLATTPAQLSC